MSGRASTQEAGVWKFVSFATLLEHRIRRALGPLHRCPPERPICRETRRSNYRATHTLVAPILVIFHTTGVFLYKAIRGTTYDESRRNMHSAMRRNHGSWGPKANKHPWGSDPPPLAFLWSSTTSDPESQSRHTNLPRSHRQRDPGHIPQRRTMPASLRKHGCRPI